MTRQPSRDLEAFRNVSQPAIGVKFTKADMRADISNTEKAIRKRNESYKIEK